jgi:hypothetical protein
METLPKWIERGLLVVFVLGSAAVLMSCVAGGLIVMGWIFGK